MKISKFVPRLTHGANAAHPRAESHGAYATRPATDRTARRLPPEHSETAFKNSFERISRKRIPSPLRLHHCACFAEILRPALGRC